MESVKMFLNGDESDTNIVLIKQETRVLVNDQYAYFVYVIWTQEKCKSKEYIGMNSHQARCNNQSSLMIKHFKKSNNSSVCEF